MTREIQSRTCPLCRSVTMIVHFIESARVCTQCSWTGPIEAPAFRVIEPDRKTESAGS